MTPTVSRTPRRHASDLSVQQEPQSAAVEIPAQELLPYHVSRTASKELPVYKVIKAGGTLKQTRIRKISGDIETLKRDVQEHLRLPDKAIAVNKLTQHVVIKVSGYYTIESGFRTLTNGGNSGLARISGDEIS